ncbi:hypothetical protein ABT282_07450 [Streptomyces sp. NPDC000927]|uniref:hypothetical protein n=1 Tax=Streptomyces sp. NPDC000927 TaxID=3154371 RepID=UPI003327D614
MRKIFAGLAITTALILGVGGNAGATPVKVKSVCDTGHRGQPAYDAKCLKTGTFKSGALLWLSIPQGKKGSENPDNFDRRSLCKFAGRFGGIRVVAREAVADTAYDTYRNDGAVVKWATSVAALDCASMGYKIG